MFSTNQCLMVILSKGIHRSLQQLSETSSFLKGSVHFFLRIWNSIPANPFGPDSLPLGRIGNPEDQPRFFFDRMDFQGPYFFDIHIPKPSKNIKFQPPGLFLVAKGHKFHTLGGFRYIKRHDCIKKNPFRTRILHNKKWLPLGWIRSPSCVCTYLNPPSGCEICAPQKTHQKQTRGLKFDTLGGSIGTENSPSGVLILRRIFDRKVAENPVNRSTKRMGKPFFFAVVNSMGKNHMNKSQNFWTRFLDPTYKQTVLYA